MGKKIITRLHNRELYVRDGRFNYFEFRDKGGINIVASTTENSEIYIQNDRRFNLESIDQQLKMIPKVWRKIIKKYGWKIYIISSFNDQENTVYKIEPQYKRIFISFNNKYMRENGIYTAYACFIDREFGFFDYSVKFTNLIAQNKKNIDLFLGRNVKKYKTYLSIFIEMFIFVIETNGRNTCLSIDKEYQYVKKWLTGEIFNINLKSIPKYIRVLNDVTEEQLEEVKATLKKLPIKIKNKFFEKNWKIIILHEKLENGKIVGRCDYKKREIYLSGEERMISRNILHEYGHFLDYQEGKVSYSKAFEKIYIRERKSIKELYNKDLKYEYVTSSATEYFADIFYWYISNPNALKKYAKESYLYIEYIVNKK